MAIGSTHPVTGSASLADVLRTYEGSDGDATRALFARLGKLGPAGAVAIELFRAQKASERAKVYRGGGRGGPSYRRMAYDKKQWAMDNLSAALTAHAAELGIAWGWGIDPKQEFHRHVLYVELPTGQISFHAASRDDGPAHPRGWDGVPGRSADRMLRWIARLLDAAGETAA